MFKATKPLSGQEDGGGRRSGESADSSSGHAAHDLLQHELSVALESNVIPRLVRSHQMDAPSHPAVGLQRSLEDALTPSAGSAAAVTSSDETDPVVLELCEQLLRRDERAADAYLDGLVREHLSPEAVLLDVLAPAARHLGALWCSDQCNFTDVTVGVWRLERMLRRLGELPVVKRRPVRGSRRILLTPAQGEQHTFGLSMLSQFFRQAGWDVRRMTIEVDGSLCQTLRNEWFDVVGISVSCTRHIESLQSSVHDIRRVSRNRSIRILVGGRLFSEHPELAERIGADGCATDGQQAVMCAESLVSLLARSA